MNLPQSQTQGQRRMYHDLAWTWPIISPKEDYVEEAEEFARLIRQYALIPAQTLLHLGCGGGHLDFTFKQHFTVTSVDLSPTMLALARSLNPEVSYLLGDMRSLRLNRLFDAVIIADSIDYMLSQDDLRAAFLSAWAHLRPGGVFCTYAEVTRETFQQHQTCCGTHTRDDLTITLIETQYDIDPTDTVFESLFIYVIRQAGQLQVETDRHLVGLFSMATWTRLLDDVGFVLLHASTDDAGIPTFVALKADEAMEKR